MFESYFNEFLKLYPSLASYLGDRTSDDRVEVAISPGHIKRWTMMLAKYSRILKHQPVPHSLENQLLKYTLDIEFEGLKYPLHLMPITSFSNPPIEFTFLEKTVYPQNNIINIKKRHLCYMRYYAQCIKNMKKGIQMGYTIPKMICLKIIADLADFIATKDYIITPKLTHFFERKYKPAIETLFRFIETTYLPACRENIGMYHLPAGKAMYKYLIKSHTTLNLHPRQVHELGLKEVKRISSAIMHLVPQIYPSKPNLSLRELIVKMQEDKDSYFHTPAEVMKAYKDKQKELRDHLIPQCFSRSVKPYEVKRVPRMLEASSAGAFYYPGDGKRPGRFFLNLRDIKENPKYTVETLSIHEGEPGHHYQFQYMIDANIPKHLIFGIEGTAFAEGWALYAESLSTSKDPRTTFGRLTYEMFRAVRCVVDTGIHYYGWTFEKCLQYMEDHIGMKQSELESELIRYICIPGQATAYKVGEQFFLDQRSRFFKKHGKKSIKHFHDIVLGNGVMPLTVLEKELDKQTPSDGVESLQTTRP